MVWKFSSWRLAPTLPGLIRYLARAAAISGYFDQKEMPVVVEVADDRHVDAQAADLADHLGDRRRGLVGVDRDPHELAAGVRQPGNLDGGPVGIGRVGVGHRLDDDRVGAADEDAADVDLDRRPPTRDVRRVGWADVRHRLSWPPVMSKNEIQARKTMRDAKPTR